MTDMHAPRHIGESAQAVHGRVENQPVHNMDVGVISPDRHSEMAGHGFNTVSAANICRSPSEAKRKRPCFKVFTGIPQMNPDFV
jgi:hypothetical protein